MTPSAVMLLRAARARCSNGGWIGPPMVMNHRGEICDARDEAATYFDILGALEASNPAPEDLVQAWGALDSITNGLTILWEEKSGRTEAEVLDLFNRAIARATALSRKGT